MGGRKCFEKDLKNYSISLESFNFHEYHLIPISKRIFFLYTKTPYTMYIDFRDDLKSNNHVSR